MVTIKDGLGARQVTAEEAFLFYLGKKAVDGSEAAQERLEEIQAFRRERDPDLGPEGITTIGRVIVSPDNPNHALRLLKMAEKFYPFQPHAQIKLEPWLVQRALDRLGDRRLNAKQQVTVAAATRTPKSPMAGLVGDIVCAEASAGAAAACAAEVRGLNPLSSTRKFARPGMISSGPGGRSRAELPRNPGKPHDRGVPRFRVMG